MRQQAFGVLDSLPDDLLVEAPVEHLADFALERPPRDVQGIDHVFNCDSFGRILADVFEGT